MKPRSESPVRVIFEELRFNYDVTEAVSQAELIQFAQLSGCSDLIEEAWLTTDEYERRVVGAGGRYPVAELRESFQRITGVQISRGGS